MTGDRDRAASPPDAGQGDGEVTALLRCGHLDRRDALTRLEAVHDGAARVVECRVVAGMTIEETAAAQDVSPATVKRHWELARVWLGVHLKAAAR